MQQKVLKINPADNVIVALRTLEAGETIEFQGEKFVLIRAIPAKHKFVTKDFAAGDFVIMYGVVVGKATQPIQRGEQVTTFNVKHESEEYSVHKRKPNGNWKAPDISKWANRTFMGYYRSDGQVGTANYWLVLPLVFCENRNILKLKEAFDKALGYAFPDVYLKQVEDIVNLYKKSIEGVKQYSPLSQSDKSAHQPLFKNLDGIKFLTHESGCGESNQESAALAALFGAYANNANVAGITVLSLGCQKTQFTDLTEEIKKRNASFDKPVLFFEQQSYGTEFEMLSSAIKETFLALTEANKAERKPASVIQTSDRP